MNPPETKKTRILIIDDNPSIHEDIRNILTPEAGDDKLDLAKAILFDEKPALSHKTEFEIDSAFQGQEGLQKVQVAHDQECPYALAFVDVRMPPGWDGIETIKNIWEKHSDLQIVICTAYSDYSWDEMIRTLGRSDSLVILKKPFDNIEVLQLAHALTEKWRLGHELKNRLQNLDLLVTERTTELQLANEQLKKEMKERVLMGNALRLSEERFSKAFKASPIPLAIQSLRLDTYVDMNEGFEQLTGYSRAELIGRAPKDLNIWEISAESAPTLQMLQDQAPVRNRPGQLRTKAGQRRHVLLSAETFELDDEPMLLTITQDITEQIAMENQLRQSQKMEAVGQLAAGVAHDFNNRLAVILGHAGLLMMDKAQPSDDSRSLQAVIESAEKASKLVRQLLLFSRKQVMQMRAMDANEILLTLSEMLPRVLGENILVKINPSPNALWINADAGMVEQMLMNCAINARDAMPGGGELTISAERVTLAPGAMPANPDAAAGDFTRISVVDNGAGIPPEILPRIFEPFFTTKPVGKGTGLGLATAYGIAKQHGGWVEVQSQLGAGATFHIFIPTSAASIKAEPPPPPPALKGGHETILVAEDDKDVRSFVVEVLNSHGYKVIDADSGVKAMEIWTKSEEKFDLLLTDLVMPGGLTGHQLADNLRALEPQLRVLFTSGYSPGMAGKELSCAHTQSFLAKPYQPSILLQRVRACLDN